MREYCRESLINYLDSNLRFRIDALKGSRNMPTTSDCICLKCNLQTDPWTCRLTPEGVICVKCCSKEKETMLPTNPKDRKDTPITTGVLDYFPLAMAAVAQCSKAGNDQHNPGQPLHWAKEKSTDHADCITRHLIERGTKDTDGIRHSAKVAWRALALLQTEIEADQRLSESCDRANGRRD